MTVRSIVLLLLIVAATARPAAAETRLQRYTLIVGANFGGADRPALKYGVSDAERFARRWMELVDRHGGRHHGYFLPAEGASDKALALFSFPSLAAYEQYRGLFGEHPDFVAADRIRDESGCVLRYERTFMRPLLPGD